MSQELDDHGQPFPAFNRARRVDRAVHEMLGIAKGMIIDGVVSPDEAAFLTHWVRANPDCVSCWPGDALATRLQRIYADGEVGDDEREDLLHFLQSMAGEDHGVQGPYNAATRLPLDDPAPPVLFAGFEFVFTGRFIWGTREACETAVTARGGIAASGITRRTGFLVLGDLGSRDWVQTAFGRKIEKAVAYKREGIPIAIVDEQHWASQLGA
jgi:hypothetical protein